jgi:succinate-acetate transporter protein
MTLIAEPELVANPFAPILDRPEKGAGVFFPETPQGISLQLGSLAIVLSLLSLNLAHVFSPAALGIMLPVALSVGAVGIFIGGMWNFRLGLLVPGVIGALYGVFWFSFGLLLLLQAGPLTAAVGPAGFAHALGTYLWIWMVVSAALSVATYFVNRTVFIQQTLLTVVVLVLAIGYVDAPSGSGLLKVGGYLGVIDAAIALYIAMSFVINEAAGRTVVPLP